LETTAKGAAYLAGLKVGVWKNLDELKRLSSVERLFMSQFDDETRNKKYSGWLKAINATRNFKIEEGE
jgi:glycerol kinase